MQGLTRVEQPTSVRVAAVSVRGIDTGRSITRRSILAVSAVGVVCQWRRPVAPTPGVGSA